MLNVTREQRIDRWDALPIRLREAVFSARYGEMLWEFCEKNHLSEERTEQVAAVAGDVMMGFLHANREEVAREIEERARLPKQLAWDISGELDAKVFAELKTELMRVYAPGGAGIGTVHEPKEIAVGGAKRGADAAAPATLSAAPPSGAVKESQLPESPRRERSAEPGGNLTPFMLHEEQAVVVPSAPPERPSVSFTAAREVKVRIGEKPVAARIESPGPESDDVRVVHYSNLRTPLDAQ